MKIHNNLIYVSLVLVFIFVTYISVNKFWVKKYQDNPVSIGNGQLTQIETEKTTTDNTVNKVYKNLKFNLQLKYPSTWVVISEAMDFGEYIEIGDPELERDITDDSQVFVSVDEIGDKTLEDFMDEVNISTGELNKENYKFLQNINIDGQKGILTYGGCCGLTGPMAFVKKGSLLYRIGSRSSQNLEAKTMTLLPNFSYVLNNIVFTE